MATKSEEKTAHSGDRGLVFNIQKFSLHDGTGIRTLIFLKGCPLTCGWCANPEGQSRRPELAFNLERCIGVGECGLCLEPCGHEAIKPTDDGKIAIDRKLCSECGDCVETCPSRALELFGDYMSVEDALKVVEEDSAFYARSGGGLTLSGGEPLLQADFAIRLLKTARDRGIDTAIETTGHCAWDSLEAACHSANQIFYDVKSLDSEKHTRETGVDNGLILENLRKLRERFPELAVTARTPIVPGFNDLPEDVEAIGKYLQSLPGDVKHELLPYHGFGEPKYGQLGMSYPMENFEPPSEQRMTALRVVSGPLSSRSDK
jgi:pyruvate formate lyase activating enzyme